MSFNDVVVDLLSSKRIFKLKKGRLDQFLESVVLVIKLINAFVQKLKGSMDIESNNGTQITLNLNIKTPAA
ncbi:MAG: hypothetical protein IPL23_01020 [Saprospiraceae bacterium]|nr:hypothetical protein [Saprospiraceae bacterium]